jgi:putative glutamine amidotransferase
VDQVNNIVLLAGGLGATEYSKAPNDTVMVACSYVDAVRKGGALPLIVPPDQSGAECLREVEGVAALLLIGGRDVDPGRYGQDSTDPVVADAPERDAAEIALVHEAVRTGTPILGVCRGAQVLNVAFGGTLVQDLYSVPEHAGHGRAATVESPERPGHDVRVARDSKVAQLLGDDPVRVNSFHHQAVASLGDGLVATAWSEPDGVIEGIEHETLPLVVGVQWHPERLSESQLIQRFIESARQSQGLTTR